MEQAYYDHMHVREISPSSALKPYIRNYYLFENEGQALTNLSYCAFPNGMVEIFLLLAPHKILLHQDHHMAQTTSFISGIIELDQALKVNMELPPKYFKGISIFFTPLGVNRLLGYGLNTLTNQVFDLKSHWRAGAKWLLYHVQHEDNESFQIQSLNHYFQLQLNVHSVFVQKIIPILNKMEQSAGYLSVGEVAREMGVSYKWLYRIFVDELGITPKAYQRIIRFDRACLMLDRYRDSNETDIAHQCGYYDQAHFIHEFKKIMKLSPREYMRKRQGRFYYRRAYAIP